MKKIKVTDKLTIFLTAYAAVVVIILIRLVVLSLGSIKTTTPPKVVQLNTNKIDVVYNQMQSRSGNNFTGKPDLTQFVFGKVEPFQ